MSIEVRLHYPGATTLNIREFQRAKACTVEGPFLCVVDADGNTHLWSHTQIYDVKVDNAVGEKPP